MLYYWHCLWEEIGYTDKIVKIIEGACKWEIEHGLEVTFSDGEIIYVGGFGDYGPNTSRLISPGLNMAIMILQKI